MPAVLHPESVVLIRHVFEPMVLNNVDAISVVGGEQLPPDPRYSVGYRGPEVVGLVLRGGEHQRFDDVQVVVIKGGVSEADLVKKVPVIGGGGITRRMIVDDGGIGLGQIDNVKQESEYIDEIDAYLRDKAKATREAGGDEFYGRVGMKQERFVELNREAPFARTNPVSILNGILGNAALIASGETAKMLVNWQGLDAETTPVAITLAVAAANPDLISTPGGTATSIKPYGIVQFGTGGFLVSVEVDIAQGCEFSVSGSQIAVSVAMDPQINTEAVAQQRVTAMLSFRSINRHSRLTRTRYVPLLTAAAVSGYYVIPVFAQDLIVLFDEPNLTSTISWYTQTGLALGVNRIAASTTEQMKVPILVPKNAWGLTVTNSSGSTQNFTQLQFGLNL